MGALAAYPKQVELYQNGDVDFLIAQMRLVWG